MLSANEWTNLGTVRARSWTCGYCDLRVGNDRGYFYGSPKNDTGIYLCPHCGQPTYFQGDKQVPGAAFGDKVEHLPGLIDQLYDEARNCMAVNAFTSAVLACRKLLMHIAVDVGAPQGANFLVCVNHLEQNGFIPARARSWVEHIRNKGNEANHEIVLMTRPEAENLMTFIEMLLKVHFEFPAKIGTP